jgi:Protein of unknown function (DUF1524)/Domain of unknown function (DUF4268)
LLLERLDAAYGHKERVDTTNATIEHVMPQTPTDWWKAHLGDDWEDDHGSLLHTLGNLTLTSYNPELSNDTFPEKQKLFASSNFELNQYFEGVVAWNAGEIERRADALSDLALTIWPYFGPAGATEAPSSELDVTSTLPRMVVFRGQEFPVRSWTDVLTTTLEQILLIGPDDFQRVVSEFGRIVNTDPGALRRARRLRRLSNGAYVETNHSAAAIYRICVQALGLVGVGPDEWRVDYVSLKPGDDAGEDGGEAPSQLRQLRQEFWIQVREALLATGKFSSLRPARSRYWYDIAVGRSDFWLSLTANVAGGEVAVKLHMNEEVTPAMESLLRSRAAIEAEVGAELEWNPHPEKKQKSIRLRHAAPIADRESWPPTVEWLVRYAVAMKGAFSRRIAELEF